MQIEKGIDKEVKKIRVLILDNELHEETIASLDHYTELKTVTIRKSP